MKANQIKFKAYKEDQTEYKGCDKSIINLGHDSVRKQQTEIEALLFNHQVNQIIGFIEEEVKP